jgi:putative nucleotidyltransferase with HDIG domain
MGENMSKSRIPKKKIKNKKTGNVKEYLKSQAFHRILIGVATFVIVFVIVESGAAPVKYDLKLGQISNYDITAPRDIENYTKMEENARLAAKNVLPVIKKLDNATYNLLNKADEFMTAIDVARTNVEMRLQEQGISSRDWNYKEKLELEQKIATEELGEKLKKINVTLSEEQINYLISKADNDQLSLFNKLTRDMLYGTMKEEITEENLALKKVLLQNEYQSSELSQDMINIGSILIKDMLEPNSIIDEELTEAKREEAAKNAMSVKVIVKKGSRIISIGDMVTEDKLNMLQELSLIETGKFDYAFALGIFMILLLLFILVVIFMDYRCPEVLHCRSDIMVLSVIVIMTLVLTRVINEFSSLLIPIFIAPMLISLLLNLELAIIINFVLAISISLITKGNSEFLYMSLISGTFSAFIVSKANQRSRLSVAGVIIGLLNSLIIVCVGVIQKEDAKTLANQSLIALLNGLISIIFTIGILPFLEIVFKIITPLKLLELANPNQPLIKRLLIEAPGTYHHSLMVGNLAEVATEAIEGDALLARVGAYYHDVGKLKRPNFFIENQMTTNPHDKMSPNLSTLVITSHTSDGVELAEKYKVPTAIRDIIQQHHGNTLVAYFYHKAKKGEKEALVKAEDFRYDGPKPSSKEAAVVMLADSVEAAVRSMSEKTEGKIEGLVRKIIKDKLDDGQLDECSLTLKDLDIVAKSFMQVFSGYFHEREEYPELNAKKKELEYFQNLGVGNIINNREERGKVEHNGSTN